MIAKESEVPIEILTIGQQVETQYANENIEVGIEEGAPPYAIETTNMTVFISKDTAAEAQELALDVKNYIQSTMFDTTGISAYIQQYDPGPNPVIRVSFHQDS